MDKQPYTRTYVEDIALYYKARKKCTCGCGMDLTVACNYAEYPCTEAMKTFIRNFDSGKYPNLFKENTDV